MKAIAGAIVLSTATIAVCLAATSTSPDRSFGLLAGFVAGVAGLIGFVVGLNERPAK